MNTLVSHIKQELLSSFPPIEAQAMAWYIAEEITGVSRTELLCKDTTISDTQKVLLEGVIQRALRHEPLQYIFGYTVWRGMQLKVSPAVLIPRAETAELVDWVLEDNTTLSPSLKVVDIGTGSGCIALSIKQERKHWQVYGIDISQAALQVASENAQALHLPVTFQQIDILQQDIEDADIIVSNPPYIRPIEKQEMDDNVVQYEPHRALFVPQEDPLIFYRRIASLKKSRTIYFEINQYLAPQMVSLMEELGYHTVLRNDIFGNARMLRATLI